MDLRKEMFEMKKNNVNKRNEENLEKLIEIMGEEKAEKISNILDYITKMRHEIHSSDSLFHDEYPDFNVQHDFLNTINQKLKEIGLPIINFSIDFEFDLALESDYYNGLVDNLEEHLELFQNQKEIINNEIEKWLYNFDKKYGTNYCPTGWDRLK